MPQSITTSIVKEVSDKRPAGIRVGQSSADLVGFYGATTIDRIASATFATVSAQTTKTTTALRTDLDNVIAGFNVVLNALLSYGLISSS
jgi:hypothetical protein